MKKLALLILAFALCLPSAYAAGLININTADATLLDTLPGIGPSKAGAIIQYRSQHGDFATIADIQDVSGIGPATFANIEALITVGDSGDDTDTEASSSAQTEQGPDQDVVVTTPSTPSVLVHIALDHALVGGAEGIFTASVENASGTAYTDAQVAWTWGDGSSGSGLRVAKTYAVPGTYIVEANALTGSGSASAEATVVVRLAAVSLPTISSHGITVANGDASNALDLSDWKLASDSNAFTIPPGTKIAAGASVTFPPEITGLDGSGGISLLYPSGKTAAVYDSNMPALRSLGEEVQPSSTPASSYEGSDIHVTAPAHAIEPARAPAAPTEVRTAGAALPAAAGLIDGSSTVSKEAGKQFELIGLLESPWTLGVLGLLVFSGGALIVL